VRILADTTGVVNPAATIFQAADTSFPFRRGSQFVARLFRGDDLVAQRREKFAPGTLRYKRTTR